MRGESTHRKKEEQMMLKRAKYLLSVFALAAIFTGANVQVGEAGFSGGWTTDMWPDWVNIAPFYLTKHEDPRWHTFLQVNDSNYLFLGTCFYGNHINMVVHSVVDANGDGKAFDDASTFELYTAATGRTAVTRADSRFRVRDFPLTPCQPRIFTIGNDYGYAAFTPVYPGVSAVKLGWIEIMALVLPVSSRTIIFNTVEGYAVDFESYAASYWAEGFAYVGGTYVPLCYDGFFWGLNITNIFHKDIGTTRAVLTNPNFRQWQDGNMVNASDTYCGGTTYLSGGTVIACYKDATEWILAMFDYAETSYHHLFKVGEMRIVDLSQLLKDGSGALRPDNAYAHAYNAEYDTFSGPTSCTAANADAGSNNNPPTARNIYDQGLVNVNYTVIGPYAY
jgi:hypothetical protein